AQEEPQAYGGSRNPYDARSPHDARNPRDARRAQQAHDAHEAAMRAFGIALKRGFAGWRVHVLSNDPALPRQLGMKERRRTPLFNGALECRLFGFEIFAPREMAATADGG
ncbi:MAG: hypothetical protein J0H09_06225, partial [Burkholderiales bacterium]|nr:hypothetical protein [Burkholderiales bacterium]